MERVRSRLLRAAAALERAGVSYAVIGGNAVAAWVATVDEAAVRNTQDVDILLRRDEFERAKQCFEAAGFVYRHVAGMDLFLDGPDAKARDSVHVVFARERVRPHYEIEAPDPSRSEFFPDGMRVLSLDDLIRMKLTSFRRKDQVHLLDLIEVGLLSERDIERLPPALGARLRELIENPEG